MLGHPFASKPAQEEASLEDQKTKLLLLALSLPASPPCLLMPSGVRARWDRESLLLTCPNGIPASARRGRARSKAQLLTAECHPVKGAGPGRRRGCGCSAETEESYELRSFQLATQCRFSSLAQALSVPCLSSSALCIPWAARS